MSTTITPQMREQAEEQIKQLRSEINYDTRDYAIDFLVQEYRNDDFYIPDEYQRRFVWEEHNKTRFIESILLGLPIPFMFFSDTKDGRCEIIDGAQRTQTLEEYMDNDLVLSGLKKLSSLNGFRYENLPEYYRRKFNKTTMRVIVLSDDTTLEIRQEIFNRINTTGMVAKPSEIRRGSFAGPFMDFLKRCTTNPIFTSICPISEISKKRYEDLELVLRFFAFSNNYLQFSHRVDEFLDEYIESNQDNFDINTLENEFNQMLAFVNNYFPFGFRKTMSAKSTPRVRFEAISVGVCLALRQNPSLVPASMEWIDSDEFKKHTTTHASNSPVRVSGRIEYVRNMLLAGDKCAVDD